VHPRALEPGSRQHILRGGSLPQGYRGNSHDDTHPDNSMLHMGKIHSAPLYIYRIVLLLLRQRRGVAGNVLRSQTFEFSPVAVFAESTL
jgi:hypothetical protein